MKKYQLCLLIGNMLLLEGTVWAGCCPDQIRCRYSDPKLRNQPNHYKVAGLLHNGELREYSQQSGCYPAEFANKGIDASIKECAKQFPEKCGGDKCIVVRFDNKCGNSGTITPLKLPQKAISPEICAPNNIINELGKNLLCTDACNKYGMVFSGNAHAKTDKDCRSSNPPNTQGSMYLCRPK